MAKMLSSFLFLEENQLATGIAAQCMQRPLHNISQQP